MVARLVFLVSCLLVMMAFVANPEAGARGRCAAGKVVTRTLASAVGSESVLAVRPIHIAFTGEHKITDRAFVLLATPPLPVPSSGPITVEVEGDLQEENGDDTFPAEGISARAKTTGLGNVELDVCADRLRPERVQPGRYTGAITLRGTDFASTTLAIDVTVQGSQWRAVLLIAAGLILGVLLKLFPVLFPNSPGTGEKQEEDGRGGMKALLKKARGTWRAYRGTVIAVVILALVSGFASYYLLYASNATWGASPQDKLKLILAGVTLQVTGMTTAEIIGDFAGRSRTSRTVQSNGSD